MPNIILPCELSQKVDRAIAYIKSFEPESEPYYLAYSGGKDSDTIKILSTLAGVRFDAVHNLTSVDAPETVRYIKSQNDVHIEKPRDKDGNVVTMWNLIPRKKMPPTRLARYCCKELKEYGGKERITMTGVRWAESAKRAESGGLVKILGMPKTTKKEAEEQELNFRSTNSGGIVLNDDNAETRRFVEHCYRTRKTLINPIIDWTDDDVWDFLKYQGCSSNPLYQCGKKRIGCIGCPNAGGKAQKREFEEYPIYRQNYVKAFDRMLKNLGKDVDWRNGEEVMTWWVGDDYRQITFENMEVI